MVFAAVLALMQSFAEITDDRGLVVFWSCSASCGSGQGSAWIASGFWRSVVSLTTVLAVVVAVWWTILSTGPAAQVMLAIRQPQDEAAIAALPADQGHRQLSWYWGDVGSVMTGGVRYHTLVYDEAGTLKNHYSESKYCVDDGPCTLRPIRGHYHLVMSWP